MTVSLRRAINDDVAALIALVEEYSASDGHTFVPAIARRGLAPLLADDEHGVVWVIEENGTIDGYAAVTWGWSIEIGGFEAVLDELYVRSRRRGYGSLLLQTIETDCRTRGAKRIFLQTKLPNDGARRLYVRHGFVSDDSIWMSKELS